MQLDKLLETWEFLGPRERLVLLTYAMRLANGQRKYGQLTTKKKDWTYEAIEEALDASVYLTALLQDRVDTAFNASLAEAEAEVLASKAILGPDEIEITEGWDEG